MIDTFSALKSNRQDTLAKLSKQLSDASTTSVKRETDPRLWYPDVDKGGNGLAVIRFLPAPKGEDSPFVRLFSHSFQGPTGLWYIENCLTTLGKQDPVAEVNSQLWNSGVEANKEIARKQKRKLTFISNILVIRDPANPENEGQVRLFKYGKKIYDKINGRANPSYPDDPKIDVFDFWSGSDFRMVIHTRDGWRNYDESEFGPQKALFVNSNNEPDDTKMKTTWDKQYPLEPFLVFKSYSELKTQLNRVLGVSEGGPVGEDPPFDVDDAPLSTRVTESESVEVDDDSMKLFDDLASLN